MLNRLRTYQTLTRFLAMVLLVASVLPFIGHVCMMAEAHEMPELDPCCCEDAHRGHPGMEEMQGAQCEVQGSSHEDNQENTPREFCCQAAYGTFVTDTASRNKATTQKHVSMALFDLASRTMPAYPRFQSWPLLDLGPPPLATPPLHILYMQILN